MIDTSRFKGHTPGPWIITHDKHEEGVDLRLTGRHPEPVMDFPYGEPEGPDLALIAAAPDLLAEVERLRETVESENGALRSIVANLMIYSHDIDLALADPDDRVLAEKCRDEWLDEYYKNDRNQKGEQS